jgi:hypothetical protein
MIFEDLIQLRNKILEFYYTKIRISGTELRRTGGQTYREAVTIEIICDSSEISVTQDRAVAILEDALRQLRSASTAKG